MCSVTVRAAGDWIVGGVDGGNMFHVFDSLMLCIRNRFRVFNFLVLRIWNRVPVFNSKYERLHCIRDFVAICPDSVR